MPPSILRTDPRSRFLKGFDPQSLKEILAAARPRRVPARSVVVQQEHPADQLFLLTKGHARYFYITEEGRKIVLASLLQGDVFGAAAQLSEPSW
jgi:CRP-like cAMP-binding protein